MYQYASFYAFLTLLYFDTVFKYILTFDVFDLFLTDFTKIFVGMSKNYPNY